jgi:5-methylcytosine-specific restriction endonuclease McrA
MDFEFKEDRKFFEELLCHQGESIEQYNLLFDFRSAKLKRTEFSRIRTKTLKEFLEKGGAYCELNFEDKCDIKSGLNIDHLIPLSSNKLNKQLRKLKAAKGKKVMTQSFGSNNIANLILTCRKCNGFKKHKFLERNALEKILDKQRKKLYLGNKI